MSDNTLHDIRNTLHRLELMGELLNKNDFSTFSKEEILTDVKADLAKLDHLFLALSNGQ
jgi:hypothetical protein